MRTSRRLLRQVRRALLVTFLFSAGINVLMLATPLYALQIFDNVVPTGSLESLVVLTAMAGLVLLVMAIVEICRESILLRTGLWLDHVLGRNILENGLGSGTPAGELRQQAAALSAFRGFLTSGGFGPLCDLPWVPVFLAALYALSPTMGIYAAAVSAAFMVAAFSFDRLAARTEPEAERARGRAEHWWSAVSRAPQLSAGLGLATGAANQWERFNRAHVAAAYTSGNYRTIVAANIAVLRMAAQIGCYSIGAWLVAAGEMTPGALVAALIILSRLMTPLEQLGTSVRGIAVARQAYRRLAASPAISVPTRADDIANAPFGRLVLSDVSFCHATRRTTSLSGVNIALEPGECLGIVGRTGAGKSTLAALLAGAAQPNHGSAEFDGVAITNWQRAAGGPLVGYQPDEPALMHGTVHENIARFSPASPASVVQAATRAGVHQTLTQLQNGYATQIGSGGSGLTMRERRAVAFARALHGRPRLVVIDEPELGHDAASLKRLTGVLEKLKEDGVALVIVTQAPALLALTDKIAVLADGTVEWFGRTSDLAHELASGVEQGRYSMQPTRDQPAARGALVVQLRQAG